MVTGKELFNAILAMDSYNRGYDSKFATDNTDRTGLGTIGSKIGNVTVIKQSDVDAGKPGVQASFYAVAYENIPTGEQIISYRGTNAPKALDISNGWITGLGDYTGTQVLMAADFYNTVVGTGDFYNSNIELVGHSLGGGLAGVVAGVYGQNAAVFDNMPFELSASSTYDVAISTAPELLSFKNIVLSHYYSGNENLAQANNFNNINAYATTGEVLGAFRGQQSTTETEFNPNANEGPFDLHSQALLVNLMFADGKGTDWINIAPEFIDTLFDDAIGIASGSTNADQMLNKIAYSAIASGTTVFGNTAIHAMWDDANDLGKVVGAAGVSSILDKTIVDGTLTLNSTSQAISKIFVQYAGQLASARNTTAAKTGVLSTTFDGEQLNIDLSSSLWGATTNIIGRGELLNEILFTSTFLTPAIRGTMQSYWGDGTDSAFHHIILAAKDSGVSISTVGLSLGTNENVLIIGEDSGFFSGGDDTITGSAGNDMIAGSGGDDSIFGGNGKDILFGGTGHDTIDGGGGDDMLNGGIGVDVYKFTSDGLAGNGVDTIIDSDGGSIVIDGAVVSGTALSIGAGKYALISNGSVYTLEKVANANGGNDLKISINDNSKEQIIIKDFTDGDEKIQQLAA